MTASVRAIVRRDGPRGAVYRGGSDWPGRGAAAGVAIADALGRVAWPVSHKTTAAQEYSRVY
jgi:hypothetical protein